MGNLVNPNIGSYCLTWHTVFAKKTFINGINTIKDTCLHSCNAARQTLNLVLVDPCISREGRSLLRHDDQSRNNQTINKIMDA